jgi:hypothetical protein
MAAAYMAAAYMAAAHMAAAYGTMLGALSGARPARLSLEASVLVAVSHIEKRGNLWHDRHLAIFT